MHYPRALHDHANGSAQPRAQELAADVRGGSVGGIGHEADEWRAESRLVPVRTSGT